MKLRPVFVPLKQKKSLNVFIWSALIITAIYFSFSVLLSLLSTRPLPKANITDLILFGSLKAFATFNYVDWIILAMFPLAGGILFANYSYWKCKSNKTAKTGLAFGLLAATCPACILPVVGFYSFVTFLTGISIYIKLGALLLVIGATVFVANQKNVCVEK